jgi:cobalt-zinc-cadmium resistance protein CzcA
MAVLIPAVLLVILALLYASFKSLKLTLLIALNMPVAMSGGLVTLWLTGTPLSLSAVVGCVALFGVAVMNGVVLLSRTRALHDEVGDALKAARLSALERLRPVFTTALVAGLGFVPMALAQGVGAEVQRPLALVVIGGLVTSTTLTLLTLPTLYAWLFKSHDTNGEEGELC